MNQCVLKDKCTEKMGLLKNERELKKSWDNKIVQFWEADDGVGDRRYIYRENLTYEQFKEKIDYYMKQIKKGQKEAYIKEIL